MKRTLYTTLAVFWFAMAAQADVISLNFVRVSDGSGLMEITDVAGVVPVDNWNTSVIENANEESEGINLVNDLGEESGAIATWLSGAASWSTAVAGAGDPGDKLMMTGYLDQSGNGLDQIHMVNVSNIPYINYDVYLYHSSSGGPNRSARYQANGIDLYSRNLDPAGTFDEFLLDQHDTLEDSNDSESGGNYVFWTNLSGDLMIEGQGIGTDDGGLGGNTRRAPIQGIQIVRRMTIDLPGDFDMNGVIDLDDFATLASNFNAEGDYSQGDFNLSGEINLRDFVRFREAFAAGAGAAAAVPEPSCLMLFGLGSLTGVAVLRRRRR